MPAASRLPVFGLNLHQDFQCHHSGACCTAGWDIGVGRAAFDRLTAALETGALRLPPRSGVPANGSLLHPFVADDSDDDDLTAVVARAPDGACAFFDRHGGHLCAIHSQLGEPWLPPACRHFPRTYLVEDNRILVTLSHACPSAAALLFRTDIDRLAVVRSPMMCHGHGEPEGFDARQTVPPFVRPGVAFDRASQDIWEAFVLSACSCATETAEQTILKLAKGAGVVRSWTARRGPMADFARDALGAVLAAPAPAGSTDMSRVITMFAMVVATVPAGLPQPGLPDYPGDHDTTWVAPAWAAQARAVRRYVAARAFAAWSAYRGEGVRTQVAVLAAALAVLRIETIRRTAEARRVLDEALLLDAVQSADGLTVHRSRDAEVCRHLGRVEDQSDAEYLAGLGVCPE